ncbi:MAG: hypothetical protein WBC91_09280 [Phototrophicaceae bacterium]
MFNIINNGFRFMLLWAFGSIASLFASAIVGFVLFIAGGLLIGTIWGSQTTAISSTTSLFILGLLFGIIGLAMGLIFGSIQKSILRGHTREPWRGWLISSSIGGSLGVIAIAAILTTQSMGYIMMSVMPPPDTLLWFAFQILIIFFGCLGLCQMIALRQYVHGAWVWILANLVAGIVFYALIAFGFISWAVTLWIAIGLGLFVAAAPGIVTGFVMVWLINANWRQNY